MMIQNTNDTTGRGSTRRGSIANNARGMTLIELLVVCAIIIALLAILVPVAGKAIATAELAECASKQAQLGKTNSRFMSDNFGAFSALGKFMREYHENDMLMDPSDEDPISFTMKAKDWGFDGTMNLSYGLNGEYEYFQVGLRQVKNPDGKSLFYDGLSGDGAGDGSGSNGNGNGGNRKVSFYHLPPGNQGNAQYISVSVNAVPAHFAHDDPVTGPVNDPWDVGEYAMGEFDARHPLSEGLGNVLFVDGHVEAHPVMTAAMFNVQDPNGSSGSGGGDSGNGNNGNGGNNNGGGNGNGNNGDGNGNGNGGNGNGGSGNGNGNGNN